MLWHLLIKLQVWKYAFQQASSSLCQLEFVNFICQKVVCTQTKISVFIIRPVSNMSQVYIYQTVWEILTLGKRNKIEKRYINVLLYGIYLFLCVSGDTTRSQTMIWPITFCIEVTSIISYNKCTGTWSNRPSQYHPNI